LVKGFYPSIEQKICTQSFVHKMKHIEKHIRNLMEAW